MFQLDPKMKTNANILSFSPTTLLRQGNLIRGESKSSCQMALPAKKIDFERPFRFVVSSFNFMCLPSRSFQLFFATGGGDHVPCACAFRLLTPKWKTNTKQSCAKETGALREYIIPICSFNYMLARNVLQYAASVDFPVVFSSPLFVPFCRILRINWSK